MLKNLSSAAHELLFAVLISLSSISCGGCDDHSKTIHSHPTIPRSTSSRQTVYTAACIAPNGNLVALCSSENLRDDHGKVELSHQSSSIQALDLEKNSVTNVWKGQGAPEKLEFSSDSKRLAFVVNHVNDSIPSIHILSVSGTIIELETSHATTFAWSPDDSRIVVALSKSNGTQLTVTRFDPTVKELINCNVQVRICTLKWRPRREPPFPFGDGPDSSELAISIGLPSAGDGRQISILDFENPQRTQNLMHFHSVQDFVWSPEGGCLAIAGSDESELVSKNSKLFIISEFEPLQIREVSPPEGEIINMVWDRSALARIRAIVSINNRGEFHSLNVPTRNWNRVGPEELRLISLATISSSREKSFGRGGDRTIFVGSENNANEVYFCDLFNSNYATRCISRELRKNR